MKKLLFLFLTVTLLSSYQVSAEGSLDSNVEYIKENPPSATSTKKRDFTKKIINARDYIKDKVANVHTDKRSKIIVKKAKNIATGATKVLKVKKKINKKIFYFIKAKIK